MKNTVFTNDPYFQVNEFHFYHPALTKEYTVLQVSDLHIMTALENSSDERKAKVEKQKNAWASVRIGFAKKYGDDCGPEHLLDPLEGLSHVVELANQTMPDALLMTGDMMEDYSPENLNALTAACEKLKMPWMWVCGNHEVGYEELYKPLMQNDPDVQILDIGEIRFVGIDDAAKKVSESQRIRCIDSAKNAVLPILVMHIPMLTRYNKEETSHFDPYFLLGTGNVDESTRSFIDLMESDNDPFSMVLCGHVHGLNISEYRPNHPQLCASSTMVGTCSLLKFFPGKEVRLEY